MSRSMGTSSEQLSSTQAVPADTPFDNFATGIGGGVRYNLPIGPVRVDYGVNPAPRKNQSVQRLISEFRLRFLSANGSHRRIEEDLNRRKQRKRSRARSFELSVDSGFCNV